jgi:hypothetical protein
MSEKFEKLFRIFPIRRDTGLPDLDVKLWRFCNDAFEFKLIPHGERQVDEVYCRLRMYILADGSEWPTIAYEGWQKTDRPPEAIPATNLPRRLLNSSLPKCSADEISNFAWIVLLSRRQQVASLLFGYHGRLLCSPVPPKLMGRFNFLWVHCWQTIFPFLAWGLVVFLMLRWALSL